MAAIENCAEYAPDSTRRCRRCRPGYFRVDNSKHAQDLPDTCFQSIQNCIEFGANHLTCRQCLSPYVLVRSHHTSELLSDACVQQAKPIPNCRRYGKTPQDCELCQRAHFLVNSTYPAPASCNQTISNCDVYGEDAFTCKQCRSAHLLDRATYPNRCTPISFGGVEHCSAHGSTPNQCEACEVGYILLHSQSLGSADRCDAIPTENIVQNCSRYEPKRYTCIECEEGFFWDLGPGGPVCRIGQIGCRIYGSNDARNCTECYDGYDLIQLQQMPSCIKSPSVLIENCARGDTSSASRCVRCRDTYFLFTFPSPQSDVCVMLYAIDNCRSYTDSRCSDCQSGYYLEESQGAQMCLKGAIAFCAEYRSRTVCSRCERGKVLVAANLSLTNS